MFENFSTQSRTDWIQKANQETKQIEAVSFPFTFQLDEITLQSINTTEDSSPTPTAIPLTH